MEQQLNQYFDAMGFVHEPDAEYSQLGIAPTCVYENDEEIKAIVVRESVDSIPERLVQELAESKRIPAKTLEVYFAFPSKPTISVLRTCRLYKVGLLYANANGQIEVYAESVKIKGRKKRIEIPKTQVFFSSRQLLNERNMAEEVINDVRESLHVPIFPVLVENDQKYSRDIRKLKTVIERCMDDSDYVLIILSGKYKENDIVDWEARRALEFYDPEEILFFVKSDKETKEAWANLLLHASENGHVKYTEFIDERDFRTKFYERLMRTINRLYSRHGLDFLGDGD